MRFARRSFTSLRNCVTSLEHLRVLVADALHHVETSEEIVEVLRAEDDLDRAATVTVDVERAQPVRDVHLSDTEALLCDDEMPRVRVELGVDLPELHVRVVVRLDRLLELRLRRLDLGENGLSLRALRLDRRIGAGRGDESRQRGETPPRQR